MTQSLFPSIGTSETVRPYDCSWRISIPPCCLTRSTRLPPKRVSPKQEFSQCQDLTFPPATRPSNTTCMHPCAGVTAYPTKASPLTGAMCTQPCVQDCPDWDSTYSSISLAKGAPIYGR